MTGGSEYRITDHPDQPGRKLIRWRDTECSAVWVHVAVVDRLEDVSDAMVNHRDNQATR